MKCLNDEQLKMLAAGRLKDGLCEDLLHAASCADCRERLKAAAKAGAVGFGMNLVGARECPEYEVLSGYLDGSLADDARRSVEKHLGECELCFADVAHLSDIRAAAHLRGPVVVAPVKAKQPAAGLAEWKLALGGVLAGAVIAAVVLRPGGMPTGPNTGELVKNPPAPILAPDDSNRTAANSPAIAPDIPKERPVVADRNDEKPVVAAKPKYRTLLRDGRYSIAQVGGKIAVLRGKKPTSALEAQLEAAIQAKIRTGKVQRIEPVKMAMSMSTELRGETHSSSIVPVPQAPVGKSLQSVRPVFKWSAVDTAERYKLVVTDVRSRQVVFDAVTDKTSAQPVVALERGKSYVWRVGMRFGQEDDWSMSQAVGFRVLSDKAMKLLESAKTQMPGSKLALAVAYESVGLNDEARAEYQALARENSRSQIAARLSKSVQGEK